MDQNQLLSDISNLIKLTDKTTPQFKCNLIRVINLFTQVSELNEESISFLNEFAREAADNEQLVVELNSFFAHKCRFFVRQSIQPWTMGYFYLKRESLLKECLEQRALCEQEHLYLLVNYFFNCLEQKFTNHTKCVEFMEKLFSFYDMQNRLNFLKQLALGIQRNDVVQIINLLDQLLNDLCVRFSVKLPSEITNDASSHFGNDFTFEQLFTKIYSVCSDSIIFENFIQCIKLYNERQISKFELAKLVAPFLKKQPVVWKEFVKLLKIDQYEFVSSISNKYTQHSSAVDKFSCEDNEYFEFDFMTSKRYGSSYRLLHRIERSEECCLHSEQKSASKPGRKKSKSEEKEDIFSYQHLKSCICKAKGTWISYPSWSEASWQLADKQQNPKSKQHLTKFTDYLNKIDDDRYELDMIILNNISAIKLLERFQSIIVDSGSNNFERISAEMRKFMLNKPGERAYAVEKWAISRIYGSKFVDIMEGIQNNPYVAIPVVLRRLQEKHCEWKQLKETLNGVWKQLRESFTKKHHLQIMTNNSNAKLTQFKKCTVKVLKNELETEDAEHTAKMKLKSLNEDHRSNFTSQISADEMFASQTFHFGSKEALKLTVDLIQVAINVSTFGSKVFGNEDFKSEQPNYEHFETSLSAFMRFVSSHFLFLEDKHFTHSELDCSNRLTSSDTFCVLSNECRQFVCNFQWYTILRFLYQAYQIFDGVITECNKMCEWKEEKCVWDSLFSICTAFVLGATDSCGFEQSITSHFNSSVFAQLNCIDKVLTNIVKFLHTVWNTSSSLNLLSTWLKFAHSGEDISQNISFAYLKQCLFFVSQSERVFDVTFKRHFSNERIETLSVTVKHWRRDLFDNIRREAENKCISDHNVSKYLNLNESLSDSVSVIDALKQIRNEPKFEGERRPPIILKRNMRRALMPDVFLSNERSNFYTEKIGSRKRMHQSIDKTSCFYVPKIYGLGTCSEIDCREKRKRKFFAKLDL